MAEHKQYNYFKYKDAIGNGNLLQKTICAKLDISRGTQKVWERKHNEIKEIVMQEVQTVLATMAKHDVDTDKIKEVLWND